MPREKTHRAYEDIHNAGRNVFHHWLQNWSPSKGRGLRPTFQVTPAGDETVVSGDGQEVIATEKSEWFVCLMVTKKTRIPAI